MVERGSKRGAREARVGIIARLRGWLFNHSEAMRFSVRKILQAPLSSAMTCLVIAIALALPATFTTLLGNVQTLSKGWDVSGNITLYLLDTVEDADGAALARDLNGHPNVEGTRFIGRDEALATFRKLSGFGEVLDALDENPLPAAIVIQPTPSHSTSAQLEVMASELATREQVESAQVDLEWIQRLNAIIELIQRAVWVVAALLALAVLLVVGNTIRLDIYNRREEIVVTKLIGATNAFVRRPFLYGGLFYGLFGGVLGGLLVIVALRFLDAPSEYLASLYGAQIELAGTDPLIIGVLIAVSAALGLVGSWISVGRHLHEIEPK
ncbi:MAG: permease-like cell division protein FtsX [Pseudomonadota bacterium]